MPCVTPAAGVHQHPLAEAALGGEPSGALQGAVERPGGFVSCRDLGHRHPGPGLLASSGSLANSLKSFPEAPRSVTTITRDHVVF